MKFYSKVYPNLVFFCFNLFFLGPFWVLLIYFLGYDQIRKKQLYIVIQTFNFCIESIAPSNCLEFRPLGAFAFFGSLRAFFLEEWVRFKNFLGPDNVDKQLWFWKYNPIFLFLIFPIWRGFPLFGPFRAILGAKVKFNDFTMTY